MTLAKPVYLLLYVFSVVFFSAGAARGDVYQYELGDFLVYAEGDISFRERSTLDGYVGAGGSLTVYEDGALTNGDLFAGDWVSIRHRTSIDGSILSGNTTSILDDADISGLVQSDGLVTLSSRVHVGGDVLSTGSVTVFPSATVDGSVAQNASLPHSWVPPTLTKPGFASGGSDVSIAGGQTQAVDPGVYKDLRLSSGSTIELTAGSYSFAGADIGPDVTFDIDDSGGTVELYINAGFSVRERSSFVVGSADPAGFVLWVNGDLALREDSAFTGTIRCFGDVSLRERTEFVGSIYAQGSFSGREDSSFRTTTVPPIYYVRRRGSDSSDGRTPQTAFRTIQHAVSLIDEPGYTIYVGSGTYQENIEIGVGSGIGAVSGTEAKPNRIVADTEGLYTLDDPGEVVVDGRGSETRGIDIRDRAFWEFNGLTIRNTTSYGIYGYRCGFTASNCTIDVPSSYGVYAIASQDLAIEDCRFERDAASRHLCWVYPYRSSDPIEIRINRNDATMRGDLFQSIGYQNGWGTIRYRAWQSRYIYGFIVYSWGANIERIEINNNQVSDCYLPMYLIGFSNTMDASMSNNTISGCFFGPYVYMYRSGAARVLNNIVDTSYYGTLVYSYRSRTPIVAGNLEHDISYLMAAFHRSFEFDIITGDPQFTDPEAGDFSLAQGSPAIDAGVGLNAPAIDIAGRSRPSDGDHDGIAQIDIGAYELASERSRVRVVQWREIGSEQNR